MTSRNLHVFAISRGGEIGGCILSVPRLTIFGNQSPEIITCDWHSWDIDNAEAAIKIASMAREIQGLEYKCGPAIIMEDRQARRAIALEAMLDLLHYEKRMGDATIHFQSSELLTNVTDNVLSKLDLYADSEAARTATRHAIVILRRARAKRSFAHELWPYPESGLP